MKDNSLGIIFRTPEYGKVKQRLASETGHEIALSLYKEMLFTTIENVLSLNNVDIYGFYDGRFPEDIAFRYKRLVLIPQEGRDLGEKMYNAIVLLHTKGYGRIALIGADSPDLPPDYISEAFSGLDSSDVVIGPSEDGGYYLIGMKKPVDFIFKEITWGSSEVFMRTIHILKRQGIPYFLLPKWYDIDNIESLKRYQNLSLL